MAVTEGGASHKTVATEGRATHTEVARAAKFPSPAPVAQKSQEKSLQHWLLHHITSSKSMEVPWRSSRNLG